MKKNIFIKSIYITICIIFIIILLFIKDVNVDHFDPDSSISCIIYLIIISIINLLLLIFDFYCKKSIFISFITYLILELVFIYLSMGSFGIRLFLSDIHFIPIIGIVFGIINLIPMLIYLLMIIGKRGN